MQRQHIGKAGTVAGKLSGNRRQAAAFLAVLLLAAAGFPVQEAQARGSWRHDGAERQRYVLSFGDAEFYGGRSSPSVLYLKKELLRQYPGIDVSRLRLRTATMVAKSRLGRGMVQLRVGPERTGLQRVAGSPGVFHSSSRHTFDRVRLDNPYRQSWGPWQVHLRGNFKVRKVVLFVEEKPGRRHGRQWGRGNPGHVPFFFGMRW